METHRARDTVAAPSHLDADRRALPRPPRIDRPTTSMYRVDVDPPKHAVRTDHARRPTPTPFPAPSPTRVLNPSHDAHTSHLTFRHQRSACQANRAGPPSGAVRTAAARMMGGPSISEVDVDISSAPTAKSKLSTGITSRPRSARARVPRRDTPQSPLQLFNTEDELFDTDGATSDDDLDEDTLAQITDELAQRTAAIRAKVQATHARRVGGVDAALAKLQLAVDADAYARHRAAVIDDGTIQADPRSLDPAHRAKSQQATRSRRRLCNRVGVDTAAVSRGFKSAVDKTVEEAVTKLGPSRFAATTDLSAKETKKAIAAAKAASKGPVSKKQSGSKAQTAVKSSSQAIDMKDDPEAELDGELR